MLHTPSLGKKNVGMLKTKFNVVLEQAMMQTRAGFVMSSTDADNCIQYDWFNKNGNMTHKGRFKFWKNIDRKIWEFDVKKIAHPNIDEG